MTNFHERRKHKRIQKHFLINYYDLDAPDNPYPATQIHDISVGGMCFVTERPLEIGQKIGFRIHTPFCAQITELKGTVLESREKIAGIIYTTRVQFDPLTPQTQDILEQAVKFFEKEKEG